MLVLTVAPLCLTVIILTVKIINPPADISIVGDIFMWSILSMVATLLYCLYVVARSDLPPQRKVLWAIFMLLWFPLTGPIFWYVELWKRRAE